MSDHRYSFFLCGMGLGAAAALLLAPKAGVKTRALLSKKARRMHHAISRQTDGLADKIVQGKGSLKRTAGLMTDAYEAGRHALRV